jgi:hypothetical protein
MLFHDALDVNTQMDTSPNAISLSFSARLPTRPEDPQILQNSVSRPSNGKPSIFQRPIDPNPLHLPLTDTSSTSLSMQGPSSRAPPPGFISDFPSQNISFATSSRMDTHLTIHSPQSASSSSSGPPSTVHGAYVISNQQSIIPTGPSIIHSVGLDSSPSSATLASELGFSSQSQSAQDSGFIFPPPDLADSRFTPRDSSPETPGDSHLLVVGDMLKTWVPLSSACQPSIFIFMLLNMQYCTHRPISKYSMFTWSRS